jgi:hypothetical protein
MEGRKMRSIRNIFEMQWNKFVIYVTAVHRLLCNIDGFEQPLCSGSGHAVTVICLALTDSSH